MTCTICGRYAEPDRETGYDADDECTNCKGNRQGCECVCCDHSEGSDCACECHASGKCSASLGVDPIESDLHDLGSVLASLADLVKDCHDPAKLFDVYVELRIFSAHLMGFQDSVGRRMGL